MPYRKEYTETLVLSYQQIRDIKRAQFEMRDEGFTNLNESALANKLSFYTGVLSYAFKLGTPTTLAAAVVSAVFSSPSERETTINMCRNGEDELERFEYMMEDHPSWELIEVELPFLEFVDEGFRIVSGAGILKATRINGYWYSV